ncbi:MAG: hypothetical protein RR941_04100 [Erysipelotrichaceae bacterium]
MSKKASIELRDLNNESEKKMSKESNLIYLNHARILPLLKW